MFGTVTKYFRDKGYGFIRGEDGKSYFIHNSNLDDEYIESGYYVFFRPFVNDRTGQQVATWANEGLHGGKNLATNTPHVWDATMANTVDNGALVIGSCANAVRKYSTSCSLIALTFKFSYTGFTSVSTFSFFAAGFFFDFGCAFDIYCSYSSFQYLSITDLPNLLL